MAETEGDDDNVVAVDATIVRSESDDETADSVDESQQRISDKVGAGILLRTLKAGDATNFPQRGDTCRVHYEGFLEDGTKFDSSRDRKQTFQFRLGMGQVVEGFDVAVAQMSVGQIAQISIPHIYAYGIYGYPPIIPPRSTLTFEIELINFS
eukprot:CAMPEP_0172499362 /NCGR_PEP_ID=MMETSP1066-20121228/126295_1 /TAXON_ID=671091 /ORGANISM="Coscinodiscus wailesii, Strain CCMP2513" /LENGTH=151 /DNA_ID=CAMNT_0013273069 /DNA_START=24 /DNA_END=479 /DNA_ORIENTATION=+